MRNLMTCLCAAALACAWACGAPATEKPSAAASREVRPPAVAGAFYPENAVELRTTIEGHLALCPDLGKRRVVAVIAPHAGYEYSGRCAAAGYGLLRGRTFARVIVLGPSHYGGFSGAALPEYEKLRTPLGDVPIDLQAVRTLRANSLFSVQPEADRREHSIEVQVPFLQTVLGSFRLLPVLVGAVDGAAMAQLGAALAPLAGEDTLLVASSDFTHFGERFGFTPFSRDVERNLRALDFGAIAPILALTPEAFSAYIAKTGATVCGRCPIGVLMETLQRSRGAGGVSAALVSYATSGEATGARGDAAVLGQGSVSYASIAFCAERAAKGGGPVEPLDLFPQDRKIDKESAKKLLALARGTIVRYLGGERGNGLAAYVDWKTLPADAKFKAGAFVTLKKKGELRGCIGTIQPEDPLWEAIVGNAINAAVNDYRFGPVAKDEVKALSIEISVLTPPREVKSAEDFVVGKHGILIEKGGRRAVFLPQVAPEQGWNRDQTLDHLAAKAGLEPGAWRTGTRFWVFEAQVFGEDE